MRFFDVVANKQSLDWINKMSMNGTSDFDFFRVLLVTFLFSVFLF